MTQEEKAKRYDKAIKVAKSKIKNDKDHVLYENDIIELFPELKESEGERIRKELIFYLRYQHSISENFEDIGKWIAWLEKQGAKVSAIEGFETEFERQVSGLIASAINKEYKYNQGYVKWTANALLNYAKHELEKQGEQKPVEWSEEDELTRNALINLVEMYYGGCIDKSEKNRLLNFLKSLKDRIQPQPRQE